MDIKQEGFWDELYSIELTNYENTNDEGDIWFGKSLNNRIIKWICNYIEENSHILTTPISIVDLGCGNACLLLDLEKSLIDRLPNSSFVLFGLDYSETGVNLSRKKVNDAGKSPFIQVEQCDLLDDKQVSKIANQKKFNILVDVGTLDAILLIASNENSRLTVDKYINGLLKFFDEKCVFILASCNQTEEELQDGLLKKISERVKTNVLCRIDSPTIRFGGKIGSQVTCLVVELIKSDRIIVSLL